MFLSVARHFSYQTAGYLEQLRPATEASLALVFIQNFKLYTCKPLCWYMFKWCAHSYMFVFSPNPTGLPSCGLLCSWRTMHSKATCLSFSKLNFNFSQALDSSSHCRKLICQIFELLVFIFYILECMFATKVPGKPGTSCISGPVSIIASIKGTCLMSCKPPGQPRLLCDAGNWRLM